MSEQMQFFWMTDTAEAATAATSAVTEKKKRYENSHLKSEYTRGDILKIARSISKEPARLINAIKAFEDCPRFSKYFRDGQ